MKTFYACVSAILIPCLVVAGTWMASPGKGSHAPGGVLATFSDDFNRADETPLSGGGNWNSGVSVTDDMVLVGNMAQGPGPALEALSRVTTPAFANNQKSTITIGSYTPVGDYSPVVRIQGSADCRAYIAFISSSTSVQIYKSDTSFGSITVGSAFTITAITAGDTIALSATGTSTTTLELFRNGVSQGTRTDSSSPYTGGQPGIHASNAGRIDAYSATDL